MKKPAPPKAEIAALLLAKSKEFEDLAVKWEASDAGIDKVLARAARGLANKYAVRAEKMR